MRVGALHEAQSSPPATSSKPKGGLEKSRGALHRAPRRAAMKSPNSVRGDLQQELGLHGRNSSSHGCNHPLKHSLAEPISRQQQLRPGSARPPFRAAAGSAWSAASLQSLWSSIKTGLGASRPSLGHCAL